MHRTLASARGLAVLALSACSASVGLAADIEISGDITYEITHLSDRELPGGLVLSRDTFAGEITGSSPDNPIAGSFQTCIGTTIVDQGVVQDGQGYCDTVDADGDVWWARWTATPTVSHWTIVGGTGKYEGVGGEGDTTYVGEAEAMAAISGWPVHYEGHMTFK